MSSNYNRRGPPPTDNRRSGASRGPPSGGAVFSNMSEDERQRRYEAKMAQMGITNVAPVKPEANNSEEENPMNSSMPVSADQQQYNAKMAQMGGGRGSTTDAAAEKMRHHPSPSMATGTTTTASYGISSAPEVQYGSYQVNDATTKEMEKKGLTYQQQQEIEDGELAIAMAINEEDEEEKAEKIVYAVEFDPDSKPPLHKNRRFQLYAVIGCILLIAIGAGAGIGVSGGTDVPAFLQREEPPATDAPTAFLDSDLNEKETKVYSFLTTHFSPKVIEEGSPHRLAAEWILNVDPMSDELTEGILGAEFLQRYVLAFLWHHTTDNGNSPWLSCNPPSEGEDDTCTFLQWNRLLNDDVCFEEVENANRWMSGADTCDWQGVECSTGTEVLGLDLFWQGMTGTLPTELATLTSLQKMGFAYNKFSGQIPPQYASLRTLFSIEVHGNLLTGSIPDEFYQAANETGALVLLNVGGNLLEGTLDTRIGLMTDLKGLHFFENQFTGSIPTEIGRLRYLSYSRGHGNQMEGSLPTELGNVRQLNEFWYHQSQLTGPIPSEMGRMRRMKSFRLWGNELSGPIPEELYEMTGLERFSLQDNELTGTISTAIGNLIALQELRFSENQLTGDVPSEIGQLSQLNVAWVHLNDLSGVMPEQICDLGLTGLQADCEPEGIAAVECDCCSSCCEQGFGLGTCFLREGYGEPTIPPSVYDSYSFCNR